MNLNLQKNVDYDATNKKDVQKLNLGKKMVKIIPSWLECYNQYESEIKTTTKINWSKVTIIISEHMENKSMGPSINNTSIRKLIFAK